MTRFVFVDAKGNLLTQRINQTDCRPTVAWMSWMRPDLDLLENIVGSAGLSNTSANIDLVYDSNKASPDELHTMLAKWAKSYDKRPSDFVHKMGKVVHFKCPISGNPTKGFVQINLYPTDNVAFSRVMMRTAAESQYKCRERNVLLNSIAYTAGYKINPLSGMCCLRTKRLVTRDVDEMTRIILNSTSTARDLLSVERLLAFLATDSDRRRKIDHFVQHLEKEGIPFVDDYYVPEIHYMARLRDRVVNRGLQPILESARIEHLEDLVFDKGVNGVINAIEMMRYSSKSPSSITPKIDGKICLVWGRKPTGEFVLTDKSAFGAKTYDGLSTDIDKLSEIMSNRGGTRDSLVRVFQKLFPRLEAATPKNFRGYIKGDLLFTEQPEEIKGALIFKPNFIEYSIPVGSSLGSKIVDNDVCIAAHTYLAEKDGDEEPLERWKHHKVPGLAVVYPVDFGVDSFESPEDIIQEIEMIIDEHGEDMKTLFSPHDLRSQKITDLPQLCKKYINTRIMNDYTRLLPNFMTWLKTATTERKFNRIVEYLHSPSSNSDALSAVFTVFLLLHELKTNALTQLDRQHPGNEGWVISAEDGNRVKLVDRFNFTAGNRKMWDQKKMAEADQSFKAKSGQSSAIGSSDDGSLSRTKKAMLDIENLGDE